MHGSPAREGVRRSHLMPPHRIGLVVMVVIGAARLRARPMRMSRRLGAVNGVAEVIERLQTLRPAPSGFPDGKLRIGPVPVRVVWRRSVIARHGVVVEAPVLDAPVVLEPPGLLQAIGLRQPLGVPPVWMIPMGRSV